MFTDINEFYRTIQIKPFDKDISIFYMIYVVFHINLLEYNLTTMFLVNNLNIIKSLTIGI
jgi:hypothetical protein